jgi:hypothetical protein
VCRASDHKSGADLDTVVAWCEPAAGVRALDVATGGFWTDRKVWFKCRKRQET